MGSPTLYASRPADRLAATASVSRRVRKSLTARSRDWPEDSPGALNAWLLLVTTKAPTWRDPLMVWPDGPPTLGRGHEGFYYPDPLGFWSEVRRWAVILFKSVEPAWGAQEALALTALVHIGQDPGRLQAVDQLCRPQTLLFLDEGSWECSGMTVERMERHHIVDPHRPGQFYEGFWGRDPQGRALGKAPQHPSTHNLYRASDMDEFLAAAPPPTGLAA